MSFYHNGLYFGKIPSRCHMTNYKREATVLSFPFTRFLSSHHYSINIVHLLAGVFTGSCHCQSKPSSSEQTMLIASLSYPSAPDTCDQCRSLLGRYNNPVLSTEELNQRQLRLLSVGFSINLTTPSSIRKWRQAATDSEMSMMCNCARRWLGTVNGVCALSCNAWTSA